MTVLGVVGGLFGRFAVFCGGMLGMLRGVGAVMLVKLLGAIWTFEFMAFAGNSESGDGHKEDGEKFHRAASIATRRRKATPKVFFQANPLTFIVVYWNCRAFV